jgi:hypothetical protein
MKAMHKILFVRRLKPKGQLRGHHVKVRDYFFHCLAHPDLDPSVYFVPGEDCQEGSPWADIPQDRIVDRPRMEDYDLVFLSGRDWQFAPAGLTHQKVINLIQHVKHASDSDARFDFLKRPAFRICASPEVYEAVAPLAVGVTVVIKYGIPPELFRGARRRRQKSIGIWAGKNPALGSKLNQELARRGARVSLFDDYVARTEFAAAMQLHDVFVTLPNKKEGFYLPALEAMASRCAVICSDARGNRSFCIHAQTCMMPRHNDYTDHMGMIEQLMDDDELREGIRQRGSAMAQSYSLEAERAEFHRFLERFILV